MDKQLLTKLISLAVEDETTTTVQGDVPFKIGEKYFIRTVTHYMVGKLQEITGGFLVFSDASWIADTGRFADFLNNGTPNEVEPVKGLYRVAIGAVVDGFDWTHELPKVQK